MKYGNDIISIEQVVSSTKMDLGIMDDNRYDILFEKWINEGLRHLGANSLFVKIPLIIEVKAGEKEICLPEGFKKLLGVRWITEVTTTDGTGETITQNACYSVLISDKRFLSDCGCEDLGRIEDSVNMITVNGNKLVFSAVIEADAKLEISYIGFYKDQDCMLVILADYERALSAYARMKFLQAYPERKGQFTGTLLQMASREWMNQKRWVKGVAAKNSFDANKYEISRLAKAWFSNQNSF